MSDYGDKWRLYMGSSYVPSLPPSVDGCYFCGTVDHPLSETGGRMACECCSWHGSDEPSFAALCDMKRRQMEGDPIASMFWAVFRTGTDTSAFFRGRTS